MKEPALSLLENEEWRTMDERPADNRGYYRSLTVKMVVVIIVVSLAPMLVITGTIRYYFQASYQDKVLEHLRVLVRKHVRTIDTFLNEKLSDIQVLAKSFTFEQLCDEPFLAERLRVLQAGYGRSFVDLGVVNDEGRQIAYAGPFRLQEADYSQTQWFREAIAGDDYISNVFAGLRGLPHFIVAVRGEHQGRRWILRATVDFEAFNSLVEGIRIGTTGFAFILNRKGEFQTRPHSEIDLSAEPYSTFLAAGPRPDDQVEVIQTAEGWDFIYVTAWLKKGGWLLAFQQAEQDAFSALYAARRFTVLVFLAGVLGIVAMALLLSSRMVRHIEEADAEKAVMNERMIEAGKLASVGELAAGIAHEINNPVAVMVEEAGWMEDLLEESSFQTYPFLEEFKHSLSQIKTQGSRCKQITHKLLSFARKTDPRPKKVQINDLIREVAALCQQRARYASVRIIMNLASDLPPVSASPSEIQQVVMNLVNNSLDAIEDHGGHVEITTSVSGDHVVITVSDNGPGIPEANLARIFDPFFTTKPVGKGTGLGLSICYGIITKMGGKIDVNSSVGVGTSFTIQVPIGKAAARVEAAASPAA